MSALQLVLRSLRGEEEVQGALLPLLWSLLDALRPRNPTDKPSLGTQEAIFRWDLLWGADRAGLRIGLRWV